MGRPQRELDPDAGPIQAFAWELRVVREKAGNPKFLTMARATGRSRTALAEAAGGDHLPKWETVEAFLKACGQDPRPWLSRWEDVKAAVAPAWPEGGATDAASSRPTSAPQALGHDSAPPTPSADRSGTPATPPAPLTPVLQQHPGPPRPRQRGTLVAVLAVVVAIPAVAASALLYRSGPPDRPAGDATGPIVAVVQNKVVSGRNGFVEDSTPVYLSTRPIPRCASNGCKVTGTEMWSGVALQVLCQTRGSSMTNENLSSPHVAENPHGATSSLWYRAQMPNGVTGYISEVYLSPASRGGLDLPVCLP